MHIAIVNDDGINAPGIHALAAAAKQFGKVSVIAPDRNRSVSGQHKTLGAPLRLDPVPFAEADRAWMCDGSPSDCAACFGLGFVKDDPVDLLLSGVNPTPNLGMDLTYSGTVMAAVESSFWNVPSAAFSIQCPRKRPSEIDFSAIEHIVPVVVDYMTANPLPKNVSLNVNFPDLPWEEIKGFKVTFAGGRNYYDVLDRRVDPFGRPYYWFGGDAPDSICEEGSDGAALRDGYVSVTPIHMDLTKYSMLAGMSAWKGWEE